jgi:hypothetical protein
MIRRHDEFLEKMNAPPFIHFHPGEVVHGIIASETPNAFACQEDGLEAIVLHSSLLQYIWRVIAVFLSMPEFQGDRLGVDGQAIPLETASQELARSVPQSDSSWYPLLPRETLNN